MTFDIINFRHVNLIPEFFLAITIIFLVVHGTLLTYKKNYPLIQQSIIYLSVMTLLMVCYLLLNDCLDVLEISSFNNTIVNDYLSVIAKTLICLTSACCLLITQQTITNQRINNFEYVLLILFSILGLLLLCSSNDLMTAYLAIELQSISFYVLAAFKKNSVFSVDAGLKYFVLGAFSSSFFLFGSSIIYGIAGSTNFEDFKDLFFWVFPGSALLLSDMDSYYENQDHEILLEALLNKATVYQQVKIFTRRDFGLLIKEIQAFLVKKDDFEKFLYHRVLSSNLRFSCINFRLVRNMSIPDLFPEDRKLIKEHIDILAPYKEKLLNLIGSVEVVDGSLNLDTHPELKNELQVHNCAYLESLANRMLLCLYFEDYQEIAYFNTPFKISLLRLGLIFVLIGLFFKLGIAPFHLWAPDVYEGSPTSSTLIFSVVPKIAIFVLLCRIFFYSFYGLMTEFRHIMASMALLTVIVGAFGGLEQRKIKSLLAYSSISHMGYSLIAFSSGTFEGMQMLISYLIVYMISGLCIWSIIVLTRVKTNYKNKHSKDLTDIVLLKNSNKMLALYMATAVFSIAGMPPMIGFIAKLGVFLSAIEASMYFLSIFSILCSVVATFYYIRIVKIMYFENVLVGKLYYPIETQKAVLVVFMFFLLFFLFLNPSIIMLISYKICLLYFV